MSKLIFSVNVLINQLITEGKVWQDIICEENYNISTAELETQIVEMYDLDKFVLERLIFSYNTFVNEKNK